MTDTEPKDLFVFAAAQDPRCSRQQVSGYARACTGHKQ